MSLAMEPSHEDFERSHMILDSSGREVKPHSRVRSVTPRGVLFPPPEEEAVSPGAAADDLLGGGEGSFSNLGPHNTKPSEHGNLSSMHSVYTQYSVLMADGVMNQIDDDLLEALPGRYQQGSVKAKITWFGALCLAGVGMFTEAFVIITTGQLKSIWHAEYPTCWDADHDQPCPEHIQCCGLFENTPEQDGADDTCAATFFPEGYCDQDGTYREDVLCHDRVTGGVSYSEFAGIMFGMVAFGFVVDCIGRKNAGTITSLCMLGGIAGMTLYDSDDLSKLFIVFSVFFALFGLGVGGEYPLTASGAADHHVQQTEDALMDDEDQHRRRVLFEAAKTARRGETISVVFAMQGMGAVAGSIVLLMLIYVADQSGVDCDDISSNSTGNDPKALSAIWRSFYLIGMLFVTMLLLYRWLILEEDTGHNKVKMRQERREKRLGKSALSKARLFQFYSFRLIGTGGNWFVWDVAFYGLKLYSGPIFRAINPEGSLIVQNGWLLFNNLCALAGYYCAARVIDIPAIGRRNLQMVSFAICAFLFFLTAAIFNTGKTQTLMFLYFSSSFFGQFGANVTTYVVAAETFPGELRATFHGFSAFLGKAGALLATVIFATMDSDEIFYVCGGTSIIGLVLTYLFTVDLTHVSLAEHDAQLELFLEGRLDDYKGKLNAREHLSNVEIWLGRHGEYDPNWVSKFLKKPATHTRPPSLQGSLRGSQRHHRRRRSLSAKSGVPVFVAVEEAVEEGDEQGNDEHDGRPGGKEQWAPWNDLTDQKSTVQVKDDKGGEEERMDKVNETKTEKEYAAP